MVNGQRDLSSIRFDSRISREDCTSPKQERVLRDFIASIVALIGNQDATIIASIEEKKRAAYVNVELYFAVYQLMNEYSEKEYQNHGHANCYVCAELDKYAFVIDSLVTGWRATGVYHMYTELVRFRDDALTAERTVN